MLTVAAVVENLEQWVSPHLAAEWDNVGLLLGDRAAKVERIMTCLTVTPDSAAEAVEAGADLIISHHPILFRPVQRLTSATPEGRMLLSLLRAGAAVYSPHTAFDNARGGINDILARRLGLINVVSLRRSESAARSCKIVVFVPDADLARVSDALFAAGAGRIGEYSQCSYRLSGTGTFFGSESAQPTVGQKGRREEVSEWRLEVLCPAERVEEAVSAMRKAHSYEEPAFDVYPLRSVAADGEGRWGRLAQPMPLAELAQKVKIGLNASAVQMMGEGSKPVERLAVVCGAGGEFLSDTLRAGAEVLLTGEMRFHDCLSAQAQGLALLLPGHYASERCGVEELAERLRQQWPQLHVWPSQRECDPICRI